MYPRYQPARLSLVLRNEGGQSREEPASKSCKKHATARELLSGGTIPFASRHSRGTQSGGAKSGLHAFQRHNSAFARLRLDESNINLNPLRFMPEDNHSPERELDPVTHEEIHNEDFHVVLKELLDAYRPVLEEELKRSQEPDQLTQAVEGKTPNCEDELALANRLFERFFTEQTAIRMLPAQARELLGPIDRWRWCFLHIRCCIIFGWLICRGPRTFRAFVYYLYRYWLCVRQVLGTPVASPPTDEQRQDFRTLVQALAEAYKPYLTDQLATVEFASGLPDEALSGQLDCNEGEEAAGAIFERVLNANTAPALLGRAVFEQHSKDPFFWFCRCWCLCAIRFGCCLARARTLLDLIYCLVFYRRCLRDCFQPLRCELLKPTGCVEEEVNPNVGGLSVTVVGTAAGAFFGHYTLEWRKVEGDACDDNSGFSSDGVVYPGGGASGNVPVNNGILGWIDTTVLPAGSYEIRVCVYSTQSNTARKCCCIEFNLFKRLVWIDHVAGQPVQTGPGFGPFNPKSPIVDTSPGGVVVPVGCCVTVRGSAFVGECNNRKIKCFDLRYGLGFLPGPEEFGFNPAAYIGSLLPTPVCYTPPDEAGKRAPWNQVVGRLLTTQFVQTEIELFGNTIKVWKLHDFCFNSASQLPPCPDAHHTCRSGRYTLLLDVEDTLGNHYYDTQHVWFDNKPIHIEFSGLEGVQGCEDVELGNFIPPGSPCGVPWPMNLLGTAYDEYIDNADLSYPSDNFDFYNLRITRQGGPTYHVPITPSLAPPFFGPDPLKGNHRVGDPGTRCETAIGGCPPPPIPPKFFGVLTQLDLRVFDDACAGALVAPFAPPANFALKRGECCGYTFQLYGRDKTRSTSPSPCHERWSLPWAVCICNHANNDNTGQG